jgi:hypothetical protein
MHDKHVMFVAMKRLSESTAKELGADFRVDFVPNHEQAIEFLASHAPQLIILSDVVDKSIENGFLDLLLQQQIGSKPSVIIIDLSKPKEGLLVFEWNVVDGGYGLRSAPFRDLVSEVGSICQRVANLPALAQEIKSIGFYDYIGEGQDAIHVQTEVIGSKILTMRTTLIRGGQVVDSVTKHFPVQITSIERAQVMVQAQHDEAVKAVRKKTTG